MKYRTLAVRLLMVTLYTVCVLAIATLFNGWSEGGNDTSSPDQGMRLKAPSFINVAYANNQHADFDFLQEEAGISAYTNMGSPIDLTKVEPLFRGIEKQTDEYIVGSMIPPSYEELPEEFVEDVLVEDVAVHVYVHRDGWIVAYLLEWQDRSLIVDWGGYETDQLSSTTLEDAVQRVLNVSGLSSSDISYYDFGYPDATDLILIADVERDHENWDSFTVNIPQSLTVYESSWSHAGYDILESQCKFNEVELSKLGRCILCWRLSHGKLDQTQLAIINNFDIKLYTETPITFRDSPASYCAIAMVYREVEQ